MRQLPDGTIRRFPLVARPRPACLPLPQRVHALTKLADTAAKLGDPGIASTVYNQAALTASDLDLPDAARRICHQHAAAYLHAAPLPGKAAIRALEPVINLARLALRAGRPDEGLHDILKLFNAVDTGSRTHVSKITIPADLVAHTDRHEVHTWLWTVVLADGTRALTAAGRWNEALAHVQRYRGIGQRMLDGRQVAILAAVEAGNPLRTATLLAETEPGEPREQAVTACLATLCQGAAGRPANHAVKRLADSYAGLEPEPDLALFDTRLGLTILDLIDPGDTPSARRVVNELHRRALNNGYAARENLAHPLFTALATAEQQESCHALVKACGLGAGELPEELGDALAAVPRTADRTIRESLSRRQACAPRPPRDRRRAHHPVPHADRRANDG